MAFSATDSAIEGFRIAREKPLAIVGWAAVALVNGAISSVVLVTMAGGELQTYSAVSPADAAAALRGFQALMPAYGAFLLLAWIASSIVVASVNRVVLRPQDKSFYWLRLGMDEVRQAVVLLAVGVLLFLAYMATGVIAFIILGAALGAAAGVIGMNIAFGVALAAAVFAFLALLAKLSLASPMTFDLRRIEIAGAWRMTKGHFRQMLSAYLLALCMLLLVAVLLTVIYMAFASVAVGGVNAAVEVLKPPAATLSAYFTPLRIVSLLFAAVINALGGAIWFGVAPRAYQQLRGSTAASAF